MKSIILKLSIICLLLSSTSTLLAQAEAGKFLLGGGSSFDMNSSKTDDEKEFEIRFAPRVGYFVINGLAVGLELPISYSSKKGETNGVEYSQYIRSMTIAPFVQYFFGEGKIKPFILGEAGFGSAMYHSELEGFSFEDQIPSTLMYKAGAGVAVYLNEIVAMEMGLAYQHSYMKLNGVKEATNGIGLEVGFSIEL